MPNLVLSSPLVWEKIPEIIAAFPMDEAQDPLLPNGALVFTTAKCKGWQRFDLKYSGKNETKEVPGPAERLYLRIPEECSLQQTSRNKMPRKVIRFAMLCQF